MGEQLSFKAAMPLAEILATCRKNVSNTGPCNAESCIITDWSYGHIFPYTSICLLLSTGIKTTLNSLSSERQSVENLFIEIKSRTFSRCLVVNVVGQIMVTSCNRKMFTITGPLCGDSNPVMWSFGFSLLSASTGCRTNSWCFSELKSPSTVILWTIYLHNRRYSSCG